MAKVDLLQLRHHPDTCGCRMCAPYRYVGPYACNAFAPHLHGEVEHRHDGGAFTHEHEEV